MMSSRPLIKLIAALLCCNLWLLSHAQVDLGACERRNSAEIANPEVSLKTISTATPTPRVALGVKWLDELFTVVCLADGSSTRLSLDATSSIGDDSVFGGATMLIQGYHRTFETTTVRGVSTPDRNRLQHILAFSGGFQTNATLQDISILVEAGYIPRYQGFTSLDIGPEVGSGSWINVGAFLQTGYTTATGLAEAVTSTQNSEEIENSSGPLLRLKLGGRSELRLPVSLPDTQGFRLLPEAWVWYEVLDNRVYGLLEGTFRLDITDKIFYNLITFKHGSAPITFTPSTQFSTGLTIRF